MGQYLSTKGDWRSGSAGALQAQGHKFESCIAHHLFLAGCFIRLFLFWYLFQLPDYLLTQSY